MKTNSKTSRSTYPETETKRLPDMAGKETKKLSDRRDKKPLNKTLYTWPELYEDEFEDLKVDVPRV